MLLQATALLAGSLALYSYLIEPRWIRIKHRRIDLPGPPVPPVKILHLSDFHCYPGQPSKKKWIERIVQVPVDLVFITGDLIDCSDGIDLCLETLRPIRARHGIFCVLGNHDYIHTHWRNLIHRTGNPLKYKGMTYNDVNRLMTGLNDLGMVVLRNERRLIAIGDTAITIAGLDDPYTFRSDIDKTFHQYQKNGPCLALSHTPDPYKELAAWEADMVFCGHTHGGQVRIPFFGPIITRTQAPRTLAGGLNRVGHTLFHTSRGIGASRLTRPRFCCPPEINFFDLHFSPEYKTPETPAR